METTEVVSKPQVNYDILFNGGPEEEWRKNIALVQDQISKEKQSLSSDSPTQTEKDLCVGTNQRVLRDSEHYIKEGPTSEHFLQTTKIRLALLDALNVHPEARDIVYDNFFTAFTSWRSDNLQTQSGITRFFEETTKVGFPKEELDKRVLTHIGKGVVTSKDTRNDILDKRALVDNDQDAKTRLPSHILTKEIAQAMNITETELNEKVFDLIASACNVKNDLSKNIELREDLGMRATLEVRDVDIDTVIRAGVRLGIPEQKVLNTMKEVWPTPTIDDLKKAL